ncbi:MULTISPECIES: RagB/SusD family nutrient uptake outer membrane protein [Butyricimonas]|uniref:RagB/SusD family nutrient uptake outer membrane protein n=1 Tax=Butyricimonas TaxID=574697 RepID=UPI001D07AB19|nr:MULTISPECIES: RagB/SusD family nutrient uptake outer membrane protein [Butyricimonas]MCB6972106.1 RagB/SusD family nutrient uptake outer membrane protein [Butyricimonas synergistica]MCG4519331.1 RagB/SusD family nutrient uptake outer membrane protein [Butyricimonas sp. DFI.6.44]
MERYLFVLLLCCCFAACEDLLDMEPENSVTFKNAYETENDIEAAVRLCAQKLRESYGSDNENMGSYVDSVASEVSFATRNLDPSQPRNGYWTPWYELIGAANVVLHYTDQIEASRERKDFYNGQGHFYRAVAYWRLVQTWGDCVIIGDDANLDVAFPKSSWPEVLDYAINEARQAVTLLPEYEKVLDSRGNSPEYKNVPCKGAANALLAHLCALKAGWKWFARSEYQNYDEMEYWEEAERACTGIIGSETAQPAGIYRLAATPEEVSTEVFKGKSSEVIFEMRYAPYWDEIKENLDVPSYTTYLDTWALTYCYWVLQVKTSGAGVDCIKDQKMLIRVATVDKWFPKGDLRREAYFWKLDSMSHDTLREVTGGYAYPYLFRDLVVKTASGVEGRFDHFDYNMVFWRLADIYLLRAECRSRLSKRDEAIADLNAVRARARAKMYDASEFANTGYADKLRYAIFKEREKEMMFEKQRYFDVLRNGEEYVRRELSEGFKRIPLQDIIDGCVFMAIDPICFGRNTALRQNTWWNRFM